SSIHSSRPDIKAILHLHYPPCVAVSAMKQGLLIASQEAAILGPISYHDYQGMLINPAEREQIARNLGPNNKVSPQTFTQTHWLELAAAQSSKQLAHKSITTNTHVTLVPALPTRT